MNNISKVQTVLNILLVGAIAQTIYVRNKWTKVRLEIEKSVICRKIKKAANEGKFFIELQEDIPGPIRIELESKGYSVIRYSNPKIISWAFQNEAPRSPKKTSIRNSDLLWYRGVR